jgi:hypothetical protein
MIMPQLVDASTGIVRFSNFSALADELISCGFGYLRKMEYGPSGGVQVFYGKNLGQCSLLVRIKTLGEKDGRPRANTPHMSVAVTDAGGELWMNERAKLTATGKMETKAMMTAQSGFDASKPDFQGNPQYFVTILGGRYEGAGPDSWANRVHFSFPPGTDFSAVASLPEHG